MTKEAKKYHLIRLITGINDETIINKLEQLLVEFSLTDQSLLKIATPLKEKLDIDELIKQQQFVPSNPQKIKEIAKEAAIEESLEDLLTMI